MALLISSTCTNGLHGVPSLSTSTCLFKIADATRSFKTRSSLSFGLEPHAVANLREIMLKSSEDIFFNSFSAQTFDLAYSVIGFSSEFSLGKLLSAIPYMLQLDANINFFTPLFFASTATFKQYSPLISCVTLENLLPIGSFDTAAR